MTFISFHNIDPMAFYYVGGGVALIIVLGIAALIFRK
jgi:hypothetical protein